MNVVFIRSKVDSAVYRNDRQAPAEITPEILQKLKISAKAGSSSKNALRGLQRIGAIADFEEWKFWQGPTTTLEAEDGMRVRIFGIDAALRSMTMAHYLRSAGPPDIIWVEGTDFPPYLEQLFDACPDSFKLVYSKDWRPWRVQALPRYNLCLVDEEWEIRKVHQYAPQVHCGLWDKLVDYETTHVPLGLEKHYDICYVAYLRERKGHHILFEAMARLRNRNLTCVCVGDDRKGYQAELERMVERLGIRVKFAGEVGKSEVNVFINQSRVGVMCSTLDAAPRAILEYLAADVPVLVNANLWAGTRYVVPGAGLVIPPERFHEGLKEILDNPERFSPRESYLKHFSFEKSMRRLLELFDAAGCPLTGAAIDSSVSQTAGRSAMC